MLLKTLYKRFSILLTIFLFCTVLVYAQNGIMTPYTEMSDPDEFYNGATFMIEGGLVDKDSLSDELERANRLFNINTITVYGLEGLSSDVRNFLFDELDRLGMKIVVRIESYASDFAFTKGDAAKVIANHRDLIEFCCQDGHRDVVAYFAMNMPVDDLVVQKNAGGLNTKAWQQAQVEYAEEIVSLMRQETARNGNPEAKIFLSVFYGWDNTFNTPSYVSAGADGYFINNYSYLATGAVPTADMPDDKLINAKRLAISMKTYEKQYGDAPVVMEWGFHTVEFNDWIMPTQTAGVVYDRDAKNQAIKATVDFYRDNYPQVRGCLYFGFNLLKEEGNPPMLLDWCLDYPAKGLMEASYATLEGDAELTADGYAVLKGKNASMTYKKVPALQMVAISYSSTTDSIIKLYSDNRVRREMVLPASEGQCVIGVPVIGIEGSDFRVELSSDGEIEIESILFLEDIEAEYGRNAHMEVDDKAGGGMVASQLVGKDNMITFDEVRGGETVSLTYMSKEKAKVSLVLDGRTASFTVPASPMYRTVDVKVPVYRNATISIYSDSDEFKLDSLNFSGIPSAK